MFFGCFVVHTHKKLIGGEVEPGYMIRVLSIVRELAMIMLKRFWLYYNGIFKTRYAGRIIDKAHIIYQRLMSIWDTG